MATFYTNEVAFDLPVVGAGFVDETAHNLELPLPGKLEVQVLVARFALPKEKTLGAVVASTLKKQAARVAHHAVLARREATVAGRPAIVLHTRWREQGVPFFERQAHIAVTEARGMLVALTGPRDAEAAGDEHFRRILDTLSLRDPD